MKNTDHQEIQFNEHSDYLQNKEIDKLRNALSAALEYMEDADMQLAERTIRRALGEKVW